MAPTNEVIAASEVASAGADLSGTLIYALACHGGLNVSGNLDTRPLDFAEAWLSRGATLVGSTGWAYGYSGALAYQELLMADFAQALVAGDGASVGDALVRTKQNYYLAHTLIVPCQDPG